MIDMEEIREYCLSLPHTSEDMAFGEEYLLLRVCGKIFACLGLARPDYFVVKCAPDLATELRDKYRDIEPAWHWNKKYWNQLRLNGSLTEELVEALICHSYSEVVKKLPKRVRTSFPEIAAISPEIPRI